ncbi:hypothetical protein CXB51_035320 [Gossypium anomalum]|uniref:Wax synthase domain-containing protein n=1 Tax=Gossypium anomalum TaxID=47600 RepID=A0A8J5XMU1_9ROSI|nr:hypothetical protein CXB51_035320 [Gossypium anomalum]
MESELNNLIKLWVLTTFSLSYSYHISAKISKGFPRLISIFPVIFLLSILPFNIHGFHLGAAHVFVLSWMANFKLLLFAFDRGPLSPPPANFILFILAACSPFKIKENSVKVLKGETPFQGNEPRVPSLILEAVNKASLLTLLFYSYNFKQYFHKHVLLILYFFHTYLTIQFLLAVAAIPAQICLPGVELEPQFNAPVRATSLQDFWGRRWNLRVSEALRLTIYSPIKTISSRLIGSRWASLPAVFATFVTSGFMHELIYYHIIRKKPTWEITWFFVLQGVLVDIEIFLKKKLVATEKFRLHEAISGPLALANIALTAGWLSYTQLLRNGVDEKVIKEFNAIVEFFKRSTYCISSKISKGFSRLVSIFPVIILFSFLLFNIHTFHFGVSHMFFLSWMANFKLLLFAFDKVPLSPLPSKPYLFILTACLPIKTKQYSESEPKVPTIIREATNKATLLVLLFCSYNFKHYFYRHLWLQYQLISCLLVWNWSHNSKHQFEPLHCKTFGDINGTLKSQIYFIRPYTVLWASLPTTFATFVTSSLIYEMIYYNIIHKSPTWKVTWFFILQ